MKHLLIPLMLISTTAFANTWTKYDVDKAVNAVVKADRQVKLQQAICDFRENYLRNMIESRRAGIAENTVKYELYSLYAQDEIDERALKEANAIRKKAYELPQSVIDDPDLSEIVIENTYLSCFKE